VVLTVPSATTATICPRVLLIIYDINCSELQYLAQDQLCEHHLHGLVNTVLGLLK
jgi:hypothetical protein